MTHDIMDFIEYIHNENRHQRIRKFPMNVISAR